MTSITIELTGPAAETLKQLAEAERRSESEIVRDALAVYAPPRRKLPKGTGQYHSGQSDLAQKDEEMLREAAKEQRWP